ncbi:hypothetical protein B0H19DRAFT_1138836 [Mycena capillaripes]|nr:hypothetical protein B0H19DRAFT_1138836 [Mycena capillaripes]
MPMGRIPNASFWKTPFILLASVSTPQQRLSAYEPPLPSHTPSISQYTPRHYPSPSRLLRR